jgi:hypothetical protein
VAAAAAEAERQRQEQEAAAAEAARREREEARAAARAARRAEAAAAKAAAAAEEAQRQEQLRRENQAAAKEWLRSGEGCGGALTQGGCTRSAVGTTGSVRPPSPLSPAVRHPSHPAFLITLFPPMTPPRLCRVGATAGATQLQLMAMRSWLSRRCRKQQNWTQQHQ